jgi:hypothetical protein
MANSRVGLMMIAPAPAQTSLGTTALTSAQHALTVPRLELGLGEDLNHRDQEREGLARPRLSRSQQVLALEQGGDGLGLHVGHDVHPHLLQSLPGLIRQWQARELDPAEESITSRVFRSHGLCRSRTILIILAIFLFRFFVIIIVLALVLLRILIILAIFLFRFFVIIVVLALVLLRILIILAIFLFRFFVIIIVLALVLLRILIILHFRFVGHERLLVFRILVGFIFWLSCNCLCTLGQQLFLLLLQGRRHLLSGGLDRLLRRGEGVTLLATALRRLGSRRRRGESPH